MTKAEYLGQLERKLRALPESDRRDALDYYDGYLSDAEDEAAAIAQLGAPSEAAADILANHIAQEPAPGKARAGGIRKAWMVILAIFAAPIGLPIVIALASVALALFVTLYALIFSVGATALALLASGALALVLTPAAATQGASFALFAAGIGLMCLGLSILLIKATAALLKGFPMIARFVGRKIARRNRNGK